MSDQNAPAQELMVLPAIAEARGIDIATWTALKNAIYPGARDESVVMAVDYCRARQLDPLMKPVHLVPMNVKDGKTGKYEWRDVVMPGIGLYRIQADRPGNYAGAEPPEFGPVVEYSFNNGALKIAVPEYCTFRVNKIIDGRIVQFSATEYWLENYATAGKDSDAPNAMWKKRPRGQIAKCAEAQALRRGWPELGSQPTAEEMEGKENYEIKDITPVADREKPSAFDRIEEPEDAAIVDEKPQQETPEEVEARFSRMIDEITDASDIETLTPLQHRIRAEFAQAPEQIQNDLVSAWKAQKAKILRAQDAAKQDTPAE